MSTCLIGILLMVTLGKPKIYQNLMYFTRIRDFTWRVSDGEVLELVARISEKLELANSLGLELADLSYFH